MAALRRFLLRLLSFFRSGRAEADLAREIQAHLRLLEDKFVAQGLSAEDARYAARRTFGGVEQAKEHQRDARSFRWLAGWPMDLELGTRMLIKYPGLTIVAVIALSVAIGAGAAYLEFVNDLLHPTLPSKDDDRIVGIVNWDATSGSAEHRSVHDFMVWRQELESVVHLGAAQSLQRNLITDDGRSEPVRGVEISASAFRLIPSPPLLADVVHAVTAHARNRNPHRAGRGPASHRHSDLFPRVQAGRARRAGRQRAGRGARRHGSRGGRTPEAVRGLRLAPRSRSRRSSSS